MVPGSADKRICATPHECRTEGRSVDICTIRRSGQRRHLGRILLDTVLSVEEVGVYKPYPRVYHLPVDRLGVPARSIALQSSNAWVAYAALASGMQIVWCNRYGQRADGLPGAPDREVKSLAELPVLVGAS